MILCKDEAISQIQMITKVIIRVGCSLVSASLMAQWVKNLPAMQETQVLSLGWEDALEEEDGNPFQYSCLKNLIDRGAWWATIHGVAKSRT